MNVSIVMPIYNPDVKILSRIDNALKKQEFNGKLEIIKVNAGLGLADSMNYGIKKAKYPLVVTLHQDCIPSSNNWLKNLIEPFKDKKIVASVSKVYLPKELWESFDFISKVLSLKEQKIITPLLDEKGCAYRKSIFTKLGLFDGKNFRTAGEDFDMYLKIKNIGKIAYPESKVVHYHEYDWKKRLKKEIQLANGFGALVRIHGKNMNGWYKGLAKSILVIGWPLFWINFEYSRMPLGGLFWLLFSLFINMLYFYGFWKGFIIGKQTI